MKPRVLHVIAGLGIGGAEMALFRLVASSRGGDYSHAVVALTSGGAMQQRFDEAGIELVEFDFKRAPISQFFRLVALMRQRRPDIVQTWMYHADLLGGVAAWLTGNRNVIWGVHSTSVRSGGTSGFTRVVQRLCAWVSNYVPHTIVCVADASRRAHADAGYDIRRMVVVPNGFEISQLVATAEQRLMLRSQCGFGVDDVVIGSLGRFNLDKDPDNFVSAAAILASHQPQVRFLMVGKGLDTCNAELAAWIDRTGYRDRFVLLGERSDVPICLAAMDIFCLHSRTEAFPLVLGEAMAMGLPCVTTDVGDASLMIADAGVVVAKQDPRSLAQGLADVLRMTPAKRRDMGCRAKARVHAEFTMDRARKNFETIYQRITAESRS